MAPMTDEAVTETFMAPIGTEFLSRDSRIVKRPGWYQLVTPSTRHPGMNGVMHSVIGADVSQIIDETCAEYDELELPFKWSLGPPTQPGDMVKRLTDRGFAAIHMRGMCCDPKELDLAAPSDVVVRQVGSDDMCDYLDAWFRGWQIAPSEHERLGASARQANDRPQWYFFVADVDGHVAASASLFVKERSGYLMGGNVLPEFRGRGVYRSLLRTRLGVIARLGRNLATTHAREATSAPILERLGFACAYRGHMMMSPRACSYM